MDTKKYFDKIKEMMERLISDEIGHAHDNARKLMESAKNLGQKSVAKKLLIESDILTRELKILKDGYSSYIVHDNLDQYINRSTSGYLKIVELECYEGYIPDHIAKQIMNIQNANLFDIFFIVYETYSNSVKIHNNDINNCILFGALNHPDKYRLTAGKLYYIDSWVDKYSGLSLSELCKQFNECDE